jgi:hypothetical protein
MNKVKKVKGPWVYDLLSPDGFSISAVEVYASKEAVEKAYTKWAKRFESQGYYSSNNGRIPLIELRGKCTRIKLYRSQI